MVKIPKEFHIHNGRFINISNEINRMNLIEKNDYKNGDTFMNVS